MGAVWRLIEAHQASQAYRPSIREIARGADLKASTLDKWKSLRRLPEPDHLRSVARQVGVGYDEMLRAALEDAGYLGAGARLPQLVREGVEEGDTEVVVPTPPGPSTTRFGRGIVQGDPLPARYAADETGPVTEINPDLRDAPESDEVDFP